MLESTYIGVIWKGIEMNVFEIIICKKRGGWEIEEGQGENLKLLEKMGFEIKIFEPTFGGVAVHGGEWNTNFTPEQKAQMQIWGPSTFLEEVEYIHENGTKVTIKHV